MDHMFLMFQYQNLASEHEFSSHLNESWQSSSSPSPSLVANRKYGASNLMRTSSLNSSAYPSNPKEHQVSGGKVHHCYSLLRCMVRFHIERDRI